MATDRKRRLASDTYRVVGYMVAVLADARRAEAEIPDGVAASITAWRAWSDQLLDWAERDP